MIGRAGIRRSLARPDGRLPPPVEATRRPRCTRDRGRRARRSAILRRSCGPSCAAHRQQSPGSAEVPGADSVLHVAYTPSHSTSLERHRKRGPNDDIMVVRVAPLHAHRPRSTGRIRLGVPGLGAAVSALRPTTPGRSRGRGGDCHSLRSRSLGPRRRLRLGHGVHRCALGPPVARLALNWARGSWIAGARFIRSEDDLAPCSRASCEDCVRSRWSLTSRGARRQHRRRKSCSEA
jgi:hypothetical protein